jgi:hypothetical protein
MHHADVRTTMNAYGDVVTDENGDGTPEGGGPGREWIAAVIAASISG